MHHLTSYLRRSHLLRDERGGAVEKVFVVACFILVAVLGLRMLGDATEQKLKCQGVAVANPDGTMGCREGAGTPSSGAAAPTNAFGPVASAGNTNHVCTGASCMCFVAGTLVQTIEGLRPIESIATGTLVLGRDQHGDFVDWRPVVQTFVSRSRSLLRLIVVDPDGRTETFEVTPNHPFFSRARGWVQARALVAGSDALVDAEGRPLRLVVAQPLDAQVPVYNIEVAEFHTYFVGHLRVWAHNMADAGASLPSDRVAKLHFVVDLDHRNSHDILRDGRTGHVYIALEISHPRLNLPREWATLYPDHFDGLQRNMAFAYRIGFYPSDEGAGNGAVIPKQSRIQIESGRPVFNASAVRTYQLTIDEVERVLQFIEASRQPGTKYHLLKYNCTDWAADAVKAAGMVPPDTKKMGVAVPNVAYDAIKRLQEAGDPNAIAFPLEKVREAYFDGKGRRRFRMAETPPLRTQQPAIFRNPPAETEGPELPNDVRPRGRVEIGGNFVLIPLGTEIASSPTAGAQVQPRSSPPSPPVRSPNSRRSRLESIQSRWQRFRQPAPMAVPPLLHFYWPNDGTPMPSTEWQHVVDWATRGRPKYSVTLWTSPGLPLTPEQRRVVDEGLVTVREDARDFIRKDLQPYYDAALKNRSWALASDIARVAYLKKFGGVHVDSDIHPGTVDLTLDPPRPTDPNVPIFAPMIRDAQSWATAVNAWKFAQLDRRSRPPRELSRQGRSPPVRDVPASGNPNESIGEPSKQQVFDFIYNRENPVKFNTIMIISNAGASFWNRMNDKMASGLKNPDLKSNGTIVDPLKDRLPTIDASALTGPGPVNVLLSQKWRDARLSNQDWISNINWITDASLREENRAQPPGAPGPVPRPPVPARPSSNGDEITVLEPGTCG